jgi:hypothetical protein
MGGGIGGGRVSFMYVSILWYEKFGDFSPEILGKLVELMVEKKLIQILFLVKKNKICGDMVGI